SLWVGGSFVALIVLLAIFAPLLTDWGRREIDPANILSPPSAEHWLGTDANGMDVLTRLLYAGRIDLTVALLAVAIAVVIGSVIGLFTGYFGGWVDSVVMRILEVLQAFPV